MNLMFSWQYRHTDDGIFDDFPKISYHFANILWRFFKTFWGSSESHLIFLINFQNIPKTAARVQEIKQGSE